MNESQENTAWHISIAGFGLAVIAGGCGLPAGEALTGMVGWIFGAWVTAWWLSRKEEK